MSDFIILHTNDIHGRVEGMARIATLVERIRAENQDGPVLYFDLGDSEETSERLSNLTTHPFGYAQGRPRADFRTRGRLRKLFSVLMVEPA